MTFRIYHLLTCFLLFFGPWAGAQKAVLVAPTGHQKDIRACVGSDDGHYIATGADDGRVILWSATGRQLASALLNGEIAAVAISPDNKTLTAGTNFGDETGIYLFDLPGLTLRKKVADELAPRGLAYLNGGKNIAAAGWDGSLALVDARSGAVLNRLQPGSEQGLEFLVASPDGKWVATGDQSTAYLVATSELGKSTAAVATLTGFSGGLIAAQFAPKHDAVALLDYNGRLVVSTTDGSRILWQKQFDNLPKSLTFSPEGESLYLAAFEGVQRYNTNSGAALGVVKIEPSQIDRLFPVREGLFWGVNGGTNLYKFVAGSSKPVLALRQQVANGSRLAVSANPDMIGSCGLLEPTTVWDLRHGQLLANLAQANTPQAGISPDGKNVYTEHDGIFEIFDRQGKSVAVKKLGFLGGGGIALSADGKTGAISGLTTSGKAALGIFDPASGTMKKTIPLNVATAMECLALNKDGSVVAFSNFETGVQLYNTQTGALLGGLSDPETSLAINAGSILFSPSGRYMALSGAQSKVFLFETASRSQRWQWEDEEMRPVGEGLAFSSDETTLLAGLSGANAEIASLKVNGGALERKYTGHVATVNSIAFLPGDQAFVSASSDLSIRVWKTGQSTEMAQLFAFSGGREWVAVTPEGYFDGSQDGVSKLYFSKNGDFLALESLYERFYTPGLLASLLEKSTPTPSPKPAPEVRKDDVNRLKKAPTVRISYAAGQQRNLEVADDTPSFETANAQAVLKVEAGSEDDVVGEIRLYHNGKILNAGTRNLTVEDDKPAAKSETRQYDITLEPGENRFRAIALNSQRTESQAAEISVIYKPAIAPPANVGIAVHLVVVGINQYKNPKYNLNYAQADAGAFRDALAAGMRNITPTVNVHFVSDAQADKAGILAAFEAVKKEAKPRDVLVFYYAGHGVVADTPNKDFYLVPHDVTQLYGADDALAQKGISALELKGIAASIPAQKQLFILDACQSAGALGAVARGAAEEKAIAQLARSTGTHWLTAAGSEQYATEFPQLGHGVFTYALLEGLKGAADNGDKKVTVNELKSYLESAVPELTQKYKGTPQFPSSYGFGQDFPLGTVMNK